MLQARGIALSYGNKVCLAGVDLAIASGRIIGLSGASGVGKSSLGRVMAGALTAQQGQVMLDGARYDGPQRGRVATVQYAPQVTEKAVDPRWSIAKILANGGQTPDAMREAFGIKPDWLGRKAGEISGGQLARVSLARLFLPKVRFVICDEIVAHLDALSAIEILTVLQGVARESNIGILLISHNKALLNRFADQSFELVEGRLKSGK